eukprot:403349118
MIKVGFALAITLLGVVKTQECRFARDIDPSKFETDSDYLQKYLDQVTKQEAKFVRELGVDQRSGLTMDGQQIDVDTGLPLGDPHLFTASSKESLHVALLAKVLQGNKLALNFYSKEEALDMLTKKITSYEIFDQTYPGYGGFLPWVAIKQDTITPTWDWETAVPALDNGQLFWGAYGLVQVMKQSTPEQDQLIKRWTAFYEKMAANSITIFWAGNGKIRTVTQIGDIKAPVVGNTYQARPSDKCDEPGATCYLDDPYEGELFAFMMYLFAPWQTENKADIWTVKKAKLQSVDYLVKDLGKSITTQKGWWFSAHETWKYLFFPYSDSQMIQTIFENGEKIRTWDAKSNNLPGMFASINGNLSKNTDQMQYLSASGVQEVAFQPVQNRYLVTPYSTMALFLTSPKTAAAWYHNMISGPAGQTKYGSTEGLLVDGTQVSPMLTWDSKITTVLGMMGGFADAVKLGLDKVDLFPDFMDNLEAQYKPVFTNIQGADLGYALPSAQIPKLRNDFITCQYKGFGDDFAFGVATAAYQIEGATDIDGRGECIWDEYIKYPGKVHGGANATVTADFYHKYKEDIAILKQLGIKHFRMSISWPRVLPEGTPDKPNQKGIDFYNSLLDELAANGIEPYVTLFHWDLPLALFNKTNTGGWLGRDIVDKFNDYADFCFKTFGSKIKTWVTFNEPQSICWIGYGDGTNAPGRCSPSQRSDCLEVGGGGDTPTEPYITSHNLILSHGKAVQTYRQKYQKDQGGVIGMNVASAFYEPWDPNSQADIDAVTTRLTWEYAYYYDPLVFGDYPQIMKDFITGNRLPSFTDEEKQMLKGSYYFLGLNYYFSRYTHFGNIPGVDYSVDHRCQDFDSNKFGERLGPSMAWIHVYPQGLRKLLKWLDNRYGHETIYIFENGYMCCGDDLHDQPRIDYMSGHIDNIKLAITEDGVKLKGYFAWSFLDDFEWGGGYSARFGLIYIDWNTNERKIKDSAYWYQNYIKENIPQSIQSVEVAHPQPLESLQ